jgi:hypothetical protein
MITGVVADLTIILVHQNATTNWEAERDGLHSITVANPSRLNCSPLARTLSYGFDEGAIDNENNWLVAGDTLHQPRSCEALLAGSGSTMTQHTPRLEFFVYSPISLELGLSDRKSIGICLHWYLPRDSFVRPACLNGNDIRLHSTSYTLSLLRYRREAKSFSCHMPTGACAMLSVSGGVVIQL